MSQIIEATKCAKCVDAAVGAIEAKILELVANRFINDRGPTDTPRVVTIVRAAALEARAAGGRCIGTTVAPQGGPRRRCVKYELPKVEM